MAATLFALFGCGGRQGASRASGPACSIEDSPRRDATDLVVLVMPVEPETCELRSALLEEVSEDLDLVTVNAEGLTLSGLSERLGREHPQALVLVDNRNVSLYRHYQEHAPSGTAFPPTLVLMTSFVSESIDGLKNVAAIGYEPAALTGTVAMRKILDRPIERMGVIYRRPLVGFVDRQERLARVENIEFERIQLEAHPTRNQVEWALDLLVTERDIDILWVLNDNVLLSHEFLRDVWLPAIHRTHLPVLVGVEALVRPRLDFGSVAVIPNVELMGVQAANALLDMADDDWNIESGVAQPLSVKTVVNARQARKHFGLTSEGMSKIDRVLE